MIEFKPNMKNSQFKIDLGELDRFTEYMKKGVDTANDLIHNVAIIANDIVKKLGVENLPVFTMSPGSFFNLFDMVMSAEEPECIIMEFNGENEDGEYTLYVRTVFEDENMLSSSVSLIRHTEDGDYNFVPHLREWTKMEDQEEDDLIIMAEDILDTEMDEEEKKEFLEKHKKLKALREHPEVSNLVAYSSMSMECDDEEEILPILVADNPFCTGFYVCVDEKDGKYHLKADVFADDYVELFDEAYGEQALDRLDAVQDGDLTVFRTSSMDEMAKALVNLLDHYTGDKEHAVFPISGSEYVRMECGQNHQVEFRMFGPKNKVSEAGTSNLRILMKMLHATMPPVKQ